MPSLYETSHICNPSWSGHLQIDGKYILVDKSWVVLLIAVDIDTLDIPSSVICYDENKIPFRFIINSLLKLQYPFKSITTDLGKGFVNESKRLLPGIPHQVCTIHLQRYLDQKVPKRPRQNKEIILEFRDMVNIFYNLKICQIMKENFQSLKFMDLKAQKSIQGVKQFIRQS